MIRLKQRENSVYGKAVKNGFHRLLFLWGIWMGLLFSSCQVQFPSAASSKLSQHTKDSLRYLQERHYTWNTNLEVITDSVLLFCPPIKDTFVTLYRGNQVVVAEFATNPGDCVDSIWVKLAHSQEVQGWIREVDLKQNFVPTDSISEAIYLFSHTHVSYFVAVFALFVGAYLIRSCWKKQLKFVYFNDIDSVYPLLLCLLMAFSATVYETIQIYVPEMWEHFYFNPTLSPWKVPLILSVFLCSIWLFLIVSLAVLDELFRLLVPETAVFYLLGLMSACIFFYFFFILTVHFYIGYLFLLLFIYVFVRRVFLSKATYNYRCGNCGEKLKKKGECPYCGAINQ